MTTPNKPTIIGTPEQVESLIAGAPLSVTTGTTWPGGRGVSPLHNTAEWLRKCHEMTKAVELSQQLQGSWQPCAEPSWSQMTMPNIPEMLREARAMIESRWGEQVFPVDAIAMRRVDYERIANSLGWQCKQDQVSFKAGSIYGVPVEVFETAEECGAYRTVQRLNHGRKVLVVTIEGESAHSQQIPENP